ncbi:MAG: carboxylesterase family protein [Ilumatobacteraceae bacterium]
MAGTGRNGTVVETTAGKVKGTTSSKGRLTHHLGIPYAAPPVGDARWAAPSPPEAWRGTKKCTKYAPPGFQRAGTMDEFLDRIATGIGLGRARAKALGVGLKLSARTSSEDCLALNVHAPTGAKGLPVMVWIHGGDHTDGDGGQPMYNTDAFPTRGCVLVTINYRLGLMGFFAHPDLAAESPDGVSGNYGLLDQIAALEWVRDNIAAFGGDPGQVTIFGESAGGEAVLNLMTSPRARGLFHRAIAQSPSDSARWVHLRRPALDWMPAEDAAVEFADLVVGPGPGQMERLRAMEPDALYEIYREHPEWGRYFYPVVDDVILPSTPMSAFSDQQQASVPLMIGYNNDEATLFLGVVHPAGGEFEVPLGESAVTPIEARAAFERSYPSPEHVDRLMAAYPGLATLTESAVAAELRDHMFGVHVDHAARQHAAGGHPVYRYHFDAVPPSKKQTVGAFHAAEIFYVFDAQIPLMPVADDAHLLAREMGDRWFAFAATGVPDSPGRASWPAYDPGDPHHMVFDRPASEVQACPPQSGLDVMRERIAWLTDSLRASR